MKKDLQSKVESSNKESKSVKTENKTGIYRPPVITYQIDGVYYTFVHNQFVGEITDKRELINALMRINYF